MAKITANGNQQPIAGSQGGNNFSASISDGDIITADGVDTEIGEPDNRVVTPSDIIEGQPDATEGEPRKRRGRPKGSRNGATRTTSTRASKETSENIADLLCTIHFYLAALTSIDELKLDEEEASKLAKATLRVSALYTDFELPEKWLAWGGLIFCVLGTYGPRIAAFNLRKGKEQKKKEPIIIDAVPINKGAI